MLSLVNDLVGAGYTVIMNYSPYCEPGSAGSVTTTEAMCDALQGYQTVIDGMCNGTTILQGDKLAYRYFAEFQSESTDGIHPNATGGASLALLWATAIDRALNPAPAGTGGRLFINRTFSGVL